MAKTDRLILNELTNGGHLATIPSLGASCKVCPGEVPEGFQQKEGVTKHFVCSQFSFKAKCRQRTSDTLKDEEGKSLPQEQEMLDYTIDWAISQNASISFVLPAKPTRMDFQHRLEERGFIRDKKTKEIYYNLIKL